MWLLGSVYNQWYLKEVRCFAFEPEKPIFFRIETFIIFMLTYVITYRTKIKVDMHCISLLNHRITHTISISTRRIMKSLSINGIECSNRVIHVHICFCKFYFPLVDFFHSWELSRQNVYRQFCTSAGQRKYCQPSLKTVI